MLFHSTTLLATSTHILSALAISNQTYLTATAIVTNSNNDSTLECWQVDFPFVAPSTPGIIGASSATIGNFTNAEYTVLPPRFDGGIHNAPVPQYVALLANFARRGTYLLT
jgi:hypothetical protein